MQPLKQTAPVAALDLVPSFTNTYRALPQDAQALLFFLQKDVGEHRQGPKAQQGRRTHELVMVPAQLFLAILEENLDLPPRRDRCQQVCWRSLQIAGSPIARLRKERIQRVAYYDDLAAIQLADRGLHDMHPHHFAPSRPGQLDKVALAQLSRIVRELLPTPALGSRCVSNAQPAIAFDPGGDEKVPLAGGMPQAFGAVPAIQQDVRLCARDRLERPNEGLHQLDLAVELHLFGFAHRCLTIQLRNQGTGAIQQHVDPLHHTVADDALVIGGRVVLAQSLHLVSFRFAHRRIVPDHIPGHEGLFGTASTLGFKLALPIAFRIHQRLHLCAKVLLPPGHNRFLRPRGFREKPAQPTQTGSLAHLTQQSRERAPSFAFHQPQQYGHEVLILLLGVQRAESLGKMADFFIQAYNRLWHRTPPWSQGFLFTSLIPHGVLSCYPLSKSANIEKKNKKAKNREK